MEYKVKLTDNAIDQLQETVDYISRELLVPETAKRWLSRMRTEIAKLECMPERIPLTEEEPWHSYAIHKMVVDNLAVLAIARLIKKYPHKN